MKRPFLLSVVFALIILAPSPAARAASQVSSIAPSCGYRLQTAQLLTQTSEASWVDWIKSLSGAQPVTFNQQTTTITTRYSPVLFDGSSPSAYDYVLETIRTWYPDSQIEEDPFFYGTSTWKNLILTIPGEPADSESVILSAHLDSTSPASTRETLAPGADDNASGSAALLEAARLFRDLPFQHTIRLIWFTGEEQGLVGSRAYASDHDLTGVIGVINLDMFSYDSDGDRCFEMHVGTLPASDQVGQCVNQSISAYHLNLKDDYINTSQAARFSDHASFWDKGIGAVEIGENFYTNGLPNGCDSSDETPFYHSIHDTVENMTTSFGFSITQAALAAASSLAGFLPPDFQTRFVLPLIFMGPFFNP